MKNQQKTQQKNETRKTKLFVKICMVVWLLISADMPTITHFA